jgi:hypothetical protein
MKKIILNFLITLELFSNDSFRFSNAQFGYTESEMIYDNSIKDLGKEGLYYGYDIMSATGNNSNFYLGIGMDINIFNSKYNTQTHVLSSGVPIYTMGVSGKIGYSLYKDFSIPLKLKAGIGYGLIDIDNHTSFGLQYEYGAEFDIYKGFGVGIKSKYAEGKILGKNIDNNNIIYYLYF